MSLSDPRKEKAKRVQLVKDMLFLVGVMVAYYDVILVILPYLLHI